MFNEKEFKNFLKQVGDIKLTQEEKARLKSFNGKIFDKALSRIKSQIINKMLTEDLSVEYIKGAIYTIGFIRGIIK